MLDVHGPFSGAGAPIDSRLTASTARPVVAERDPSARAAIRVSHAALPGTTARRASTGAAVRVIAERVARAFFPAPARSVGRNVAFEHGVARGSGHVVALPRAGRHFRKTSRGVFGNESDRARRDLSHEIPSRRFLPDELPKRVETAGVRSQERSLRDIVIVRDRTRHEVCAERAPALVDESRRAAASTASAASAVSARAGPTGHAGGASARTTRRFASRAPATPGGSLGLAAGGCERRKRESPKNPRDQAHTSKLSRRSLR